MMTDFKVGEFVMTDRSGKAIHKLVGMNGKPLKGVWKDDRVRIPIDPHISKLEAQRDHLDKMTMVKNDTIKELEARLDEISGLLFGTDKPLTRPVNIDALNDLFRKLRAVAAGYGRECVWTKTSMNSYGEDDCYDCWTTSCGEDFVIEEEWHETPTIFCAHCGGKTRAALEEKASNDNT
jgi:hypothetical protein